MKHLRSKRAIRKIINATLKLFVRKGYHGTSISDISKEAGVTKGAIYFHFESKDALLKRILEEYKTNYLERMIEEVESKNGKAIDKMKHLLRFCLNFALENQDLCLCFPSLATELCYKNCKHEREIKGIYERYSEFFASLLEKGKRDGSFRKEISPNIVASHLIGSHDGNLLQWCLNREEFHDEDFSRSYMKYFLSAICESK